jgi:hypothetical protein
MLKTGYHENRQSARKRRAGTGYGIFMKNRLANIAKKCRI